MQNSLATDNSVVNNRELFDSKSEADLYLSDSRWGFFSVLQEVPGQEEKRQTSFKLSQMAEVILMLPKDRGTWISQAEFLRPNRQLVNLKGVGVCFVDIDCYNKDLTPEQAFDRLFLACDEANIPNPSIVINSGRGLQVKWLLDKPVARYNLTIWNALQAELCRSLEHLGADKKAKDASRVLRLVGTVNSKSGLYTKVEHVTLGSNNAPIQYNFDYLCELLIPHLQKKKYGELIESDHPFTIDQQTSIAAAREERQRKYEERKNNLKIVSSNDNAKPGLHKFSGRQLAWHRLEDIRTLVRMRGGVQPGQSMSTLFWSLNFLLLSGATNSTQMYAEAAELCKEYKLGEFTRQDELTTLYSKAKLMESGKPEAFKDFNGVKYPQLYTPKNNTLIEMFGITDDEQRELRTIISKDIARERDAKRKMEYRRKKGAVSRDEFLNSVKNKKDQAIKLKLKGLSNSAISRELKIPRTSVNRYVSDT